VQPDTLILMAFMTLLTGGLGTMFWSRLGRIEDEMRDLRHQMADDFKQVREQLGIVGSDLTHVALAVGTKPRSVEN